MHSEIYLFPNPPTNVFADSKAHRHSIMVFIEDACLWPACGQSFTCVEDLIMHVEDVHVRAFDLSGSSSMESLCGDGSDFSSGPLTPISEDFDDPIPATVHLSHVSRYFPEQELERRRILKQVWYRF